jgi:hypothetical protein
MTTFETRKRPLAGLVATIGMVLVATPLLVGVGAALMALSGRFGGAENAFTAFWYFAAAAAPAALIGAVVLLLVHRRSPHVRALVAWSVVAAGGWLFGLGSAQVSGLAEGESAQEPWMFALLGVGIAVYLLALVGLVVTGRRASR